MDLKSLSIDQLKILVFDKSHDLVKIQNLLKEAHEEIAGRPKPE